MGVARYILPALSVASAALAQDGCGKASTTLSSGGDAQAVAACKTWTGDIVAETGAAPGGLFSLDGLEKLDGMFTYKGDVNVQTFSANKLQTITKDFTLSNLTGLTTIDLSALDTAGNIVFEGLGGLSALGFGNPGLSEAGNVTIDNTQIDSLMGLQNITKLAGIDIINNDQLSDIEFDVEEIGTILIGPNAVKAPGGVKFRTPSLSKADVIVVRNCSSVDFPSLKMVTNVMGLIGNTFTSFEALNLTTAGGLVIDDNTALKNMSFPALQALNGTKSAMEIANNTKLMNIGGFGALKTVTGGVNLFGTFDSANFPSLQKIGGALKVETTSKKFDCSKLPSTGSNQVLGEVTCKPGDDSVSGGTQENGSSTGGDSSATSSSPAMPGSIPSDFMPIFGILAGLLLA